MQTSAEVLEHALKSVLQYPNSSERLLCAAATFFGFEGADKEVKALEILNRATGQMLADIERLPLNEDRKQMLRERTYPFTGFQNFTAAPISVDQAKAGILHPTNIEGLSMLHIAFSGHIKGPALTDEVLAISSDFRVLQHEVLTIGLPDSLSKAIFSRLEQIASALEHYTAFGPGELEDQLAALSGVILMNSKNQKPEVKSFFQRAAGMVKLVFAGVDIANKTYDQGQNLLQNGSEIVSFLDSLQN